MGEEAKKAEEKPPEDGKQDNKSQDTTNITNNNNSNTDKKKEKTEEESKEGTESPPQPQEIVLKVYMHCEGCARKVRRCLLGFVGVEEVLTDYRTNKVVVKGEKADPMKVMERVQRKSHRHVELLSPIPKPNPPPPPPPSPSPHEENKQQPNPPEKKQEEPKVVTVVLKVRMHCEACSQEIKKRILRMKGVECVEPDLKGSQVSVRGVFEPAKLVEYVYKRTGKHVAIVKEEVEPEPPRGEEKKEGEAGKEGGKKEEEKEAADEGGKKEKVGEEAGGGKGKGKKEKESASGEEEELVEMMMGMEMKRMENYLYYPPYYYMPSVVPVELYGSQPPYMQQQYQYSPYQYQCQYPPAAAAYPPHMFSDDNPNACSVM